MSRAKYYKKELEYPANLLFSISSSYEIMNFLDSAIASSC